MKKFVILLLCLAIFITSLPIGSYASIPRDTSYETELAQELKMLGLFKGVSETNFDLNREPSRIEAIVMLIRFIGKENAAMNGIWSHPFSDVPQWADKYIGYAYSNGLTNGISSTQYGTGPANAQMFLTFILRALGYSDRNNLDFSWNNPYDLARHIGILSSEVDLSRFWRADVVLVSYAALSASINNSSQKLADRLIESGVFTSSQYESLRAGNNGIVTQQPVSGNLTAQEIFRICSPSVIYITTTDIDGNTYAIGSGFFIHESGIAITNYHVLENAISASIKTTNGNSYPVEGVLKYDIDQDYAIIKVKGSGFNSLPLGDSRSILGGALVYAIGNPQGLVNTISEGIVSNPYRQDLNGMMQITAPISQGSSGGALINGNGEVIGVTTASLVSGQNLNFAVPVHMITTNDEINRGLSSYKVQSLKDFTVAMTYNEFQNLPDPFKFNYNEIEPNDSIYYADTLKNGTSVWGTIDDGMLDTFLVHCNTIGRIDIILFSNSEPMFLKDLILAVEPVMNNSGEGVSSDYGPFDDDTYTRILRYVIPRPGVYSINVLSNALYKTYNLETDYSFYYVFTPGLTSGENSGGLDYSGVSNNDPISTIGNYILDYGTYSSKSGTYSISMTTDTTLYWVDYDPSNKRISLASDYRNEYQESIYCFLSIDEEFDGEYYYNITLPSDGIKMSGLLEPSTLSPNSNLKYETYLGSNQDLSLVKQLAALSLSDLVQATEYIIRRNGIKSSVKELGFAYLYNTYSQ